MIPVVVLGFLWLAACANLVGRSLRSGAVPGWAWIVWGMLTAALLIAGVRFVFQLSMLD